MYPKKEWFSIYEPFEEGAILMGNDAACKTAGIGCIYMKIFDIHVLTPKDERHVQTRGKPSFIGILRSSRM